MCNNIYIYVGSNVCLLFSSPLSVLILFFMKTEEGTKEEEADDVEPLFENDTDKSHDSKVWRATQA